MKIGLIGKIIIVNILILLVYSVAIFYFYEGAQNTGGHHNGLGVLFAMCFVIIVHVCLNLVCAFGSTSLYSNKKAMKGFLLSSGVVLLVGFSTCFGGSTLF